MCSTTEQGGKRKESMNFQMEQSELPNLNNRENRLKKKLTELQGPDGAITKDQIFMLSDSQKERRGKTGLKKYLKK